MTSTTAFAPLLAPVLDDSMEVSSSPAGNHYDDEVLIDYDDYGTATFTEDERMIEDGDPARPGTATDDMMEDAEPRSPVNEEIMHDDPVTVAPESYIEDEELIDYSDEEYQDDTQVTLDGSTAPITEVTEQNATVPAENVIETEVEIVNEAAVQQPQDEATVEEPTANFLSAVAENPVPSNDGDAVLAAAALEDQDTLNVDQDDAAEELSRQVDGEEAAAQELGEQALEADEAEVHVAESSDNQKVQDESEALKAPPRFPTGLDTSAYFASDGPQTPSDTGIHPITVRYGDIVMPLFKSRIQPDGLLKDDNLASVSLGDLLDNCRHRLALKIGESLSTDQELVLSFENMGLQLVEHSPQAFETSLEDVLGVYLSLHRNDSTHPIPPLALSLSLQLKFTSSFNILKAAAQQGEGMLKFAYLRSGDEELDEYEEDDEEEEEEVKEEDARHDEYHDEYHDDEVAGEEQQYGGEDASAEDHAGEQVSNLEEGQEYEEDEYPEDQEENQEYDAGQYQESHHVDSLHEEHNDEQRQTDPIAEAGSDVDENDLPEDGEENDENLNQDALEHEADQADVHTTATESEEYVRPESPASSSTVRGDSANEPTELQVDDGNDNSAAVASEYDIEEAAADAASATVVDDVQQTAHADDVNEAPAREHSSEGLDHHSSGDLHEVVAEDGTAGRKNPDEAGSDADEHGQDDDLPADDLDFDEGDLPAVDGEQFDTAFDLLEDHDFEQVAENGEPSQPADGLEYDDDDIGFNDDVEEAILASNSPLGKRSFDEHVGNDDVAEEQEPKKVRS